MRKSSQPLPADNFSPPETPADNSSPPETPADNSSPPETQSPRSPQSSPKKINLPRLLTALLPCLFWLGLWQWVATRVNQEILLPTPWVVGETLVNLASTPLFWQQLLASLVRITGGLLVGSFLGIALATLTWRFSWVHALWAPALHTLQATPVVSFILLVLMWLPRDAVPATVSLLMVLPILWTNTKKGLEQTPLHLVEFARAYGFSPWEKCRLLYAPSLLPHVRAGLSVAIGLGWKSGVAAEVICRPSFALGTEMNQSKLYFETPALFAYTIVVILLSATMERLVLRGIPRPVPEK